MISARIFPIHLFLKTPIEFQGIPYRSRSGFYISLSDNKNNFGFGECMPLPGFHKENLNDCLNQWHKIKNTLEFDKINFNDLNLGAPYLGLLKVHDDLHPSLQFALDQALLTLFLRTNPEGLRQLFRTEAEEFSTLVNGILIPSKNSVYEVEQIAQATMNEGFQTLKIKVGRLPPDFEIFLIQKLNQCFNGKVQLRLDGNQLFTYRSFEKFSKQLIGEPIEYFEEPIHPKFASKSKEIYDDSPLPIALDESIPLYLSNLEKELDLPKNVNAIVVKPTLIGGLYQTIRLLNICKARKIKFVLSSTFDSGWTIATYGLLSQLSEEKTAMGLDTYKYLETDILKERLHYFNGRLWLNAKFWSQENTICNSNHNIV